MNSRGLNISSRIVDTKTKYFVKLRLTANQKLKIYFKILLNSQITSV